MIATLNRFFSNKDVTFGSFKILTIDHPPIYTLELPWLNNQQNVSCIPEGAYKCVPYSSERYKDVYHLRSVPGRARILIHIGNYPHDTEGCILPGINGFKYIGKDHPMVSKSADALKLIRQIVEDREFSLTVRSRCE